MRLLSRLPFASLLAAAAFALSLTSGTADPVDRVQLRDLRGWGMIATTDKPYYQSGETMYARSVLFNATRHPTHSTTPSEGGNGCEYVFRLLDASGDIVWEPGSIVNGNFQSHGCSFGSTRKSVGPRGTYRDTEDIALIYKNRGGVGTLGDPLPAGFYELEILAYFGGPHRKQPTPIVPTRSFTASVPFQIE